MIFGKPGHVGLQRNQSCSGQNARARPGELEGTGAQAGRRPPGARGAPLRGNRFLRATSRLTQYRLEGREPAFPCRRDTLPASFLLSDGADVGSGPALLVRSPHRPQRFSLTSRGPFRTGPAAPEDDQPGHFIDHRRGIAGGRQLRALRWSQAACQVSGADIDPARAGLRRADRCRQDRDHTGRELAP